MDIKFCTIAINGTTSGAVDLEDCEILGLIIPTLISANLTFTVCDTLAGTYVPLKSKGATALSITATTGGFAVSSDDLVGLHGYRFVKIVADATQTTTARIFTWLLKKNWRR